MISEVAILEAKPGTADAMRDELQRARAVIAQARGYRGSTFHQAIERPERFVLRIAWDSVADHTEGFRQGPRFPAWRAHWAEYLAGSPDVLHYEVIAGGDDRS